MIWVLVKNVSGNKIYIKTSVPEYIYICTGYDMFFVFILDKRAMVVSEK